MAASPPEPSTPSSLSNTDETSSLEEEKLFDYPDADIILRSSDSRDFRVLKLFIIKTSPVLDKLVQDLPANASTTGAETSLPIVHMPEGGDILQNLLTFILPVPPALPPCVEETMELLSVAQKYEMSHILVHIRGIIALQDPPLIHKSNALHVYSLAQKYDLRQEVVQAARLTLKSTLTIENLENKLDVMRGDHLRELWRYHQRVQENLASKIDGFRESSAYKALNCLKCAVLTFAGIPKWIDDYLCFITRTPSSFDLFEFQSALLRHLTSPAGSFSSTLLCSSCASLPRQAIDEFWTALSAFVHTNMEQAESGFFSERTSLSKDSIGFSPPLPECLDVSDADVIIQSSDLVNFRVRKSILSSSSQFFKDMFSFPQSSDSETVNGLPVVRLSEDAELLRALVTVLYPIPPEIPTSYERVLALLAAAQKYDMPFVLSSIRAEVVRKKMPGPTGAQAFRAFAIASSNKLSPEMGAIARLTLDYPLTFETLGDELRLFGNSALRELVSFRKMCRDNIVSCLELFLDSHKGPSNIWVGCPSSKAQPPALVAQPSKPNELFSFGAFGLSEVARPQKVFVGVSAAANDSDKRTLPPWLHDLFTQQIGELKQYYTHALIKPSSIREKYLAALMKHSPTPNDCPTCLMVHARKGEGYCAELEKSLLNARNKVLVFV